MDTLGVSDDFFQLGQLLHPDHVAIGPLVALTHQCRQLSPQQVPGPLHRNCSTQVSTQSIRQHLAPNY